MHKFQNVVAETVCRYGAILSLGFLSGCALINPPDPGDLPKVRAALADLQITEINYNPAPDGTIDGDEFEFVELKNVGTAVIDLTGVAFTDGIEYAFEPGATIEPGAFLVLAANATGYEARYRLTPFGSYTGKLKNSGERIALTDLKADSAFLSFEFSDQSPWPTAADGGGYSLVPSTTETPGDRSDAAYWRASSRLNGSPGTDDPPIEFIIEVFRTER
jgi:hypothetical protein